MALTSCQALKIDPNADAVAKKVFDAIRHSDDAGLQSVVAPELKTAEAQGQIAQIRAYIPNGEPRNRKTVSWNILRSPSGTVVSMADEYDYGDRVALVETHLRQAPGAQSWLVDGFHVQTATAKALSANRLTLAGKSPAQILFFALVIASPILMLAGLIKVIRTKGLKRKWLWGLLAFVGLTSLQMNWATGQFGANYLAIQFIGAGVTRGFSQFSPWILTMTPPIGALLILTGLWANPARSAEARRLKKSMDAF